MLVKITDSFQNRPTKQYVTYTRYHPKTKQAYCGRTSGYDAPNELIRRRGLQQQWLNREGFNPPVLDKITENYLSIRGREQQLIDFYGGTQRAGGTAKNIINGISNDNPLKPLYLHSTLLEFGALIDHSPINPFGV